MVISLSFINLIDMYYDGDCDERLMKRGEQEGGKKGVMKRSILSDLRGRCGVEAASCPRHLTLHHRLLPSDIPPTSNITIVTTVALSDKVFGQI